MKNYLYVLGVGILAALVGPDAVLAEGHGGGSGIPMSIAITLGAAAVGGTFAQGKAASAGLEAIGRNPSAKGEIQTPMLIGLAFIESLVVLAFVIAFLLQGKI